tara:strand:- start:472 stop:792 length:321 start_codon:yes stop_codon:yes gene_type:complete
VNKVNYTNGKWRLSPRTRESNDYEYKNGDWHPRQKEKKQKLKPQPLKKKMNCGAFPLGRIKEFCSIATLYILSGALGVSLAFNLIWYIEKRHLEQQNLELLEVIKK